MIPLKTERTTEVHQFQRLILKEEEKQYLFFPFQVPENVDKIELTYAYERFEETQTPQGLERKEINIVDLGLQDESNGFRGASGSNRLSVFVATADASAGYICGDLCPGTWQVMLGAYKICANNCMVDLTITFTFKERLLLKGDLHMHSTTSDGQYTVPDVIHIAKLMKLDFIFLTDHNNFYQNDYIIPDNDIVVLPGSELTHYRGHCNLLGVRRPVPSFFFNTKDELQQLLTTAQENGALVSINHPFDPDPWLWGFDVPFDLLEIQNGIFNPKNDMHTLRLWQEHLCAFHRLPIVGGSDNHGIKYMETLGSPTTFVYAQSRSRKDILHALGSGNGFVSYFMDGPRIYMQMGSAIMGDVVEEDNQQPLEVYLEGLMPSDEIKLISDKGVIHHVVNGHSIELSFTYVPDGSTFYRVEIWRSKLPSKPLPDVAILGAISNPIYIGGNRWKP